MTLDPALELTKTSSIKILEEMDNSVKEKLPNYRDDNNRLLLVKLCQKIIAACETYALYNESGDVRCGDGKKTSCAAYKATTIPGRTVRTTGGRAITRDLQAAAATATITQGAGLGHLLREVQGIVTAIEIEIEIEVEIGSKIAIGIISNGLTGAKAKQRTQAKQ